MANRFVSGIVEHYCFDFNREARKAQERLILKNIIQRAKSITRLDKISHAKCQRTLPR